MIGTKLKKVGYTNNRKNIKYIRILIDKGGDRMATASFDKDFTLNSKKAVDSFVKIISSNAKSVNIDRNLISPETERRGEQKLKQILSR